MTKQTHSSILAQSSALALATGLMLAPATASAQSFDADAIVVEGSAQIIEFPDITEVIVESEGVVIDWLPFSQQAGEDLVFQPFGTTAIFRDDGIITDFAVLNRILPIDPSTRIVFDGTVISEIQGQIGGTVFFYSPGGILVGSNAVFDVGSLGLTTAEPLTDGFGNFFFGDTVDFQPSDPTASITIDQGAQIFADQNPGSYVALFAPRIVQRGNITVDGQAALVGGEAGTITFSPDGLFDIQVNIGSDFAQPIENTGFIGGPASLDGSSRVYMVAISKNNAATIAIGGGSSLGFDIANSAFMDGDTVVLSAGFNVTAGEIDNFETSNGFLSITPEDIGFGAGIDFTSSVIGKAASDVDLFVRDSLSFDGDATFSGLQVLATLDTNFGTGSVGNLVAGGDLNLLADQARPGADVGTAQLNVFNGTTADIIGNLRIASVSTEDGNGDGFATAGTGQVLVQGAGTLLSVGGDLAVESSSDLTASFENFTARSGIAQLNVENGADVVIGGVTRIVSSAVAGSGGNAESGTAELFAQSGGVVTTGELNIASRAIAGGDAGFGGRSATSDTASLNASGAGTSITVLSANTIGDPNAGELDFLSSEAIASPGLTTDGGNATSGFVFLNADSGANLSLPDEPGNPLAIINRAVGGETFADDAKGGEATSGDSLIQLNGGVHNLGRLSVVTQAIAGSALSGTARSNAGNANTGFIDVTIQNTDATVAFEGILAEAIGGNASDVETGFAGAGFTGNVNLRAINSQLTVTSALDISSFASGGSSADIGGFASNSQILIDLLDADVSIFGDLTARLDAIGGMSLNDQAFDPNFAFLEQGGGASSGSALIFVNTSQLGVQGVIDLSSTAFGGDALVNKGGNAFTGEAILVSSSTGTPSHISASGIGIRTLASGGSILGAVNPDSFGQGGDAGTGRVLVSFDGGTNVIDSTVNLATQAQGGTAGLLQGFGGNANAGDATLGASFPGSSTITGDWNAEAFATGGTAFAGNGGTATVNLNEIFNNGGDVAIGGSANFLSSATGGDGTNGGDASGTFMRISTQSGATTQIGGSANFIGTANGGVGNTGVGGTANSISIDITPRDAGLIDITSDLNIISNAFGGAGQTGGDGTTGAINLHGTVGFNGNLQVGGNAIVRTEGFGGDALDSAIAGNGGNGATGTVFIVPFGDGITGSSILVDGDLDVDLLAVGGKGGNSTGGGDGGRGGDASRNGFSVVGFDRGGFITVNGTTNLTTQGIGGDGGNGVNGGDGGNGSNGNIQFGAIRGPGTFQNVNGTLINRGGNGGSGTTGTGGRGGDALAGNFSINAGENGLSAGDLTFIAQNFAGNGGSGAIQGDGGDTQSVRTSFGAINNSGTRANVNLRNVLFQSSITGGLGATPGLEVQGQGGDFGVTGNDVTIASFTLVEEGGPIPLGREMDFFTDNSSIVLSDATVDIGAFSLTSSTNFIYDVDGGLSTFGAGTFDLLVNSVGLGPNPADPANPFLLDVLGDLTIETTSGDIITDVNLSSGANLILNSFGGITAPELTGPSIFLRLGAGGILDTGLLTAPNGQVAIEAVDTLTAPSTVDAASLLLRSLNGNVNFVDPLTLSGSLTAEAAQSIMISELTAGTIMLTALGGDIVASGALNAAEFVDLDAGGGIALSDVNATSILATSQNGDFSANSLVTRGSIGIEAAGTIAITNIDALSFGLRSIGGFVNSSGTLQAQEDANIEAGGSININDVSAGSITGLAGSDLVVNGALSASGAIDLEATGGGLVVGDTSGASVALRSLGNNVVAQGALTSMGAVTIDAVGRIVLDSASVGSLAANAQGGDILATSDLLVDGAAILNANGPVSLVSLTAGSFDITAQLGDITASGLLSSLGSASLDAEGSIAVSDITAGSIFARAGTGSITAGSISATGGLVDLAALGAIELVSIDALSILLRSSGDAITATGAINAEEDADIEAEGDVSIQMASAHSLGLRSLLGSVAAGDALDVEGNANIAANGSVELANIAAGALDVTSSNGTIALTGMASVDGATSLVASGNITTTQVQTGALSITSEQGAVQLTDATAATNNAAISANGPVSISDIAAGALDVVTSTGDIGVAGTATVTGAASLDALSGSVVLADVSARSLVIGAGDTIMIGTFDAANGIIDLEATGDIDLGGVNAGSLAATSTTGGINATGPIATTGNAAFNARGDIVLGNVAGGSILANASEGTISASTLNAAGGEVSLNASGLVSFANANAGILNIASTSGDITSSGSLSITGNSTFNAGGALSLTNVNAGSVLAQSGIETSIGGTVQAGLINLTAPQFGFRDNGQLNAGPAGAISLNSTNADSVLVGGDADSEFAGLQIGSNLLERISAGNLAITAFGDGASITLGDLDFASIDGLANLSLSASSTIEITGVFVSNGSLALQANNIALNIETGRIDLGTDGTTLAISAGTFIAGDSGVLDGFSPDLSADDLQTLINTPAASPMEAGVITSGSLVLSVAQTALIQNTGTEDVPAGFVIGSAEGLAINSGNEAGALVVLNGQIAGPDGVNVTSDEAATAIFATAENTSAIAPGSSINVCAFTGCTVVTTETGEITSTVSASVSGATAAATSSTSGSATTPTSTTDSGSTGSGDTGSDTSGDSSSEESSSEEADGTSAEVGAAATGVDTAAGADVNVDNVDDGGGGAGEFDIEPGDSTGGDTGDAGDGGDAGSDADTRGDTSGESAGDEGSAEAEGSSDESDTSSEDGEASDEGESSEDSDAEETEESDEGEESDESEEESEEEEESEDEESSEEEEDSEGPATGPISPPPSIINTNGLDQRGTINDPISGSGNPALLDPDVTITPPAGGEGQ